MKSYLAVAFSASALVAATNCAYAQDAEKNKAPAGFGQPTNLEEVIVTAEHRANTTATTPISMAALSGADLAEKGLAKISDLERAVPSLAVSTAGSFSYINIRGIGNAVSLAGTTTGVAVFHDSLFEPDASGLGSGFFDIDSVEVLRGPQGTFVGQSSTGGALIIKSRDPKLGAFGGFLEAEYASYEHLKVSGAVNMPLTDSLAARAAVMVDRRDSYYTNLGSGKDPGNVDDFAARLGLLWAPTTALQVLLKAEFTRSRSDGNASAPIENQYVNPTTGAPQHASFWPFSTHDPYTINYNSAGTYVRETHQRISLDASYALDSGVVLRSVTGYQYAALDETADGDATFMPVITLRNNIAPKRYYSQDLIAISPTGGRLNWILGGSAFYRESTVATYVNGAQIADNPITTRRLAAYGQAGFKLTDTVELQAGLRYNNDRNTDRNKIVGISGVYTDDNVTGKLGVNWKVRPEHMVYAFYARGYKAGGVNVGQADFKPEFVDDFELGWKGSLNKAIRLELGAYYMKFNNMQVQAVNLATGSTAGVGNLSGASTIKGVDAAINGRFGDFRVDFSASYNNSELGDAELVALYALPPSASNVPQCQVNPSTNRCAGAGFNYQPYIVNTSGARNPYAPEWTFSAGMSYTFHFGDVDLRPSLRYSHTGEQYGSVFQNDDFYLMKARDLIDASVTLESGPWNAELYGKNLTDETYLAGILKGPVGLTAYYGAPREVGVRVGRAF